MVRHTSGLKTLSGTTPVELWKVTIGRSARIAKIMINNPDTSDHIVYLGSYDGTTFTQLLPGIKVLAGQTITLSEDEIPSEKIYSTSTSQLSWAGKLDSAVASSNVEVNIEVEEQ